MESETSTVETFSYFGTDTVIIISDSETWASSIIKSLLNLATRKKRYGRHTTHGIWKRMPKLAQCTPSSYEEGGTVKSSCKIQSKASDTLSCKHTSASFPRPFVYILFSVNGVCMRWQKLPPDTIDVHYAISLITEWHCLPTNVERGAQPFLIVATCKLNI